MNILLKALLALVVGVVVAFFAGKICVHFGIDPFWGWIAGVIAGLIYYLRGPGL
jgi:predicted Kef-type K+ transport protein